MKKYVWILISLALVLAMVAGCGSSGGKKFDSDRGKSSNSGASNGSDKDDAQTEDTDTDDTKGDDTKPATSPDEESAVVGVWSNWKGDYKPVLPASYMQKFMNADMTDPAVALALADEIKGDSAITDSVYVDVYRQDGTGFMFFVAEFGIGWETFNYSIEGKIMHRTDRLYNSEDDDPNWTFKDKRTLMPVQNSGLL